MNIQFHTELKSLGRYIDGLGFLEIYSIDAPFMYQRPHFHIIDPKSGRNIAICINTNKYADPENFDRLTSTECKLLDDWMNSLYKKGISNWDITAETVYEHRSDLKPIVPIGNKPNYTFIDEPDPIENGCSIYETVNHMNPRFINKIDNIGEIIEYEYEDERLFNIPHIHVLTFDHRNVQVCLHENKYADPDSRDRFTDSEVRIFNEWAKERGKNLRAYWYSGEDDRIISCELDGYNVPDYSIINEPDPIKPFYEYNTRVIDIGRCESGRILMLPTLNTLFAHVPHFYIQSEVGMIPIGLFSSEFLDPTSPKLSKKEMKELKYYLRLQHGDSGINMWKYMVLTWSFVTGHKYDKNRRMPEYSNIKIHKIKFDESNRIFY